MRKNDVLIFADRTWLVVEPGEVVRLRLLAGPDSTENRRQKIPLSFLQGRPVYRQVPAVDDVDLDLAVEEVRGDLNVPELGSDPRKWTDAFLRIHGSRPTPDMTIMLGWFANAIEAGILTGRTGPRLRAPAKPRPRPTPGQPGVTKQRDATKKKTASARATSGSAKTRELGRIPKKATSRRPNS